MKYVILHILLFYFINTYCEIAYKLKNFSNYDVISNVYAFYIIERKIYYCAHIAESANIAESAKYRRIFLKKTFDDIGFPLH